MYTECMTDSSGKVQLTIGQDIPSLNQIELYIEQGYQLPTDTTTSSTLWGIDATWKNIPIVQDTDTDVTTKKFTPAPVISGASLSGTLERSNKNAGEYASYTFKFKSTIEYTAGDNIVINFPREFDPFIGHAGVFLSQESTTYYLDCSSIKLTFSWCMVDKHKVTVSGSTTVEA